MNFVATGIGAAALMVTLVSTPAFAQNYKYSDIDCGQSMFAVTDGMKCRDSGEISGGANARGQFRRYALVSSAADVVLTVGTRADSYVPPFSMDDLKSYNAVTKRGTDWSETQKTAAGVDYMTFHDGKRSCMGFRRAGPQRRLGFAWTIAGMYCAPNSEALDSAAVAATTERFQIK